MVNLFTLAYRQSLYWSYVFKLYTNDIESNINKTNCKAILFFLIFLNIYFLKIIKIIHRGKLFFINLTINLLTLNIKN